MKEETRERNKIEFKKRKKRIAKQYKHCKKLLEKAYCKQNNISAF